jgi:hypothetical protein
MATPGTQLSPEALSYYAQMGIPVPLQQPNIQAYAQQPIQQAPQIPQPIRPSGERMQYNALVEQRFNEIANMVGGVKALVETGTVDKVRQRATQDIQRIYGSFQEPPQIIEMDGNKIAVGGLIRTPIVLPTEAERQASQIGLEKSTFELEQAKKKMEAESGKLSQDQAAQLGGLNQSVRIISQAVDLAKRMRSDPVLQETVGGGNLLAGLKKGYDRIVPGTPQYDFAANAERLNSAAFSEAIKMLQGTGAISNVEGQAITKAMTDVSNLGMSPEQYASRLDEFTNLMEGVVASKQNQISSFGIKKEEKPKIDLEKFDLSTIQVDPSAPKLPAKPQSISSPGGVQFVRDPQTGKLILQK